MAAMCPADLPAVRTMLRSFFYDDSQNSMFFRAGPQSPFQLSDSIGPFVDTRGHEEFERPHAALCQAWESDPITYEICHALIRSDILTLADDWVAVDDNDYRPAMTERMTILLSMLRVVPSSGTRQAVPESGSRLSEPWAKTLTEVYRKLAPHDAAYSQGLIPMCVELAGCLCDVTFQDVKGDRQIIRTSQAYLIVPRRPWN